MSWLGRDLVSTQGVTRDDIDLLLNETTLMKKALEKREKLAVLKNKLIAAVYMQPSLKTRNSFDFAVKYLGGRISQVEHYSEEGKSLQDSIELAQAGADVLILRHPRDGAAAFAAEECSIPVINAGDGTNQHPTTALNLLYLIREAKGLKDLKMSIHGNLRDSRTLHSLLFLLTQYNVSIEVSSPKEVRLQSWMVSEIRENVSFYQREQPDFSDKDIVYFPIAFRDGREYFSHELLDSVPKDALLLTGPSRFSGKSPFDYAATGLAVQMAVLKSILHGV